MKVINEEKVGSEVKENALMVMKNLSSNIAIASKMFSESFLKVS